MATQAGFGSFDRYGAQHRGRARQQQLLRQEGKPCQLPAGGVRLEQERGWAAWACRATTTLCGGIQPSSFGLRWHHCR